MSDWVTIIVALIGATAGIVGFIRQMLRDKPDIAQQYEQMVERQMQKITWMQERIDELTCEIDELRAALTERDQLIVEWQAGISLLITQLTANGLSPVWAPKERKKDL